MEFPKLETTSNLSLLSGLIHLLKSGKAFKNWVDENMEKRSEAKKKVSQEILKKRKIRNQAKDDLKKKLSKEKNKLKKKKKEAEARAAAKLQGIDYDLVKNEGTTAAAEEEVEGGEGGEVGKEGETSATSMEVEDEGTNGGDEEEGDGESSSSSSSAPSSTSSAAPAVDPAAPVAPTKKRGRTGPLLIMGLPECPIPKDEEIADVSDDEVAPSDDVSVCFLKKNFDSFFFYKK